MFVSRAALLAVLLLVPHAAFAQLRLSLDAFDTGSGSTGMAHVEVGDDAAGGLQAGLLGDLGHDQADDLARAVAMPAAARADTRLPRAERLLLEAGGGLAGGLAFGAATGFAGLLVACPSGLKPSPSCLRGIGWGALAGVALATPPGVFLAGRLLRGGGSFLPTLGGGLLGVGAVLLIAPFAPEILPLLVFGLPTLGSLAGYELSAMLHANRLKEASVGPSTAGGAPAMAVIARW
jgi:hypothetical protein